MSRRLFTLGLVSLLIGCWLLDGGVIAAEEMPTSIKAGDHELVRNGWGVRNKSFVKLYRGGLYLTDKCHQSAEIIAADRPMAIRIEITSGLVSQARMAASLNEGFAKSTNGNLEPIQAEIEKFRGLFADEISKHDVFEMIYLPSTGVIVSKNGKTKGIVAGIEFKKALFGIWLSERPADSELKQAMLAARSSETTRRR